MFGVWFASGGHTFGIPLLRGWPFGFLKQIQTMEKKNNRNRSRKPYVIFQLGKNYWF